MWLLSVSRVRPHRLYIGGLFALLDPRALETAGITHLVSALKQPVQQLPRRTEAWLATVAMHRVPVDDAPEEEILRYLPDAVRFIEDGLRSGGAVLVQWWDCLLHQCPFLPSHDLTPLI
ncbi:tyrosine protein phosphatase yvh1 [Ascosphaera acerosa]|nr:tyrosine protein phosphatase yvh1 [Ascosphaera acerosa]